MKLFDSAALLPRAVVKGINTRLIVTWNNPQKVHVALLSRCCRRKSHYLFKLNVLNADAWTNFRKFWKHLAISAVKDGKPWFAFLFVFHLDCQMQRIVSEYQSWDSLKPRRNGCHHLHAPVLVSTAGLRSLSKRNLFDKRLTIAGPAALKHAV